MHTGAHLAISYMVFSWAEPANLVASLAGSVFPDIQYLPVRVQAAMTHSDHHKLLGEWRKKKVFRCVDFSLQSPIISFVVFLFCFLFRNFLPNWLAFFAFNWFLHMVEDILTHKTPDLKEIEIAWPMLWPFSSRVFGLGIVSEHESKFFSKIEIALMGMAGVLFMITTLT